MDEQELVKKYNLLYLEILMRYKDYIESEESVYVAELPKLITPEDQSVVNLANKIKSSFSQYSYDRDFYGAARIAYENVTQSIATISLPLQFWLKPSQTLKCEAGDVFDKATLLCSLLIALGNVSTKVIIAAKDESRTFIVYCEYAEGLILFNMEEGMTQVKEKQELLNNLGIGKDEDLTAYEFNDKMYDDLC